MVMWALLTTEKDQHINNDACHVHDLSFIGKQLSICIWEWWLPNVLHHEQHFVFNNAEKQQFMIKNVAMTIYSFNVRILVE